MVALTRSFFRPWHIARNEAERALRRFERQMVRERRIVPDDVGLPYESFALEADDGQELAGWLVPGAEAVQPAAGDDLGVFVLHHYGGQKATVLPWLEFFHGIGLTSLAIDARGHAASQPLLDDDLFFARVADVHAACDELRRRGAQRLLLVGQSQAAALVLRAAAERREVAGVIVDSGPAATMELASWGLAGQILGTRRRPLAQGVLTLDILRAGGAAGYVNRLWGALLALRERPLLWIHGDRDRVIPRPLAAMWFRACRPAGERWSAVTICGGGHVQQPTRGSPLSKTILRFIQRLAE